MVENGSRSVAFPCVGTGIYGFNKPHASTIAIQATRKFLEKNYQHTDRIIFVLHEQMDTNIYTKRLIWMFPSVNPPLEFKRTFVNITATSCWLNSCIQILLCAMDHLQHSFTSELGKELEKLRESVGNLNSDGVLAAVSQVHTENIN